MATCVHVLRATSWPQALRIQPAAAPWMTSNLLQMQGKSVAEQLVPCFTASLRQLSEQLGRSARLWPAANEAMASDAMARNFMVSVDASEPGSTDLKIVLCAGPKSDSIKVGVRRFPGRWAAWPVFCTRTSIPTDDCGFCFFNPLIGQKKPSSPAVSTTAAEISELFKITRPKGAQVTGRFPASCRGPTAPGSVDCQIFGMCYWADTLPDGLP